LGDIFTNGYILTDCEIFTEKLRCKIAITIIPTVHKLFLTCLFLLVAATITPAAAQQYTVQGTVADTLNFKKLQYASISLVHLPDSILSVFTRADENGHFVLHPDTAGKYVMLINFPGFAEFIDVLTVKPDEPVKVGTIPMLSRTQLLNEFIVRQRMGVIKINGDTTEYVADSFKVHDNATVEDLLKRLPGLQVDKNGGITAQGEKVQKVLVDGEEFFSDDPAVVTKNLDAKSVEAVQVYDKKSDEAIFTGIDDGEKTKTINLKLKEDRKKGYFGKLQAGAGTDNYYETQGMLNAFKGKRQLSAFGIGANTGKMGLGWEDRDKYGSGNNRSYDEESGSMMTYFNSDDNDNVSWQGTYNGEGIPTAWTGGVHYNNKYNEGKQELGGNYRYAKQRINAEGLTTTQYSLQDTQYVRTQRRETSTDGQRHAADGNFEWKIDSMSTFTATVDGGYSRTKSDSRYFTETRRGNENALINESSRTVNNDAESRKFNTNLTYRKKFKKKGRNIYLNFTEQWTEGSGTSYLKADNAYFTDGGTNVDTTDQLKNSKTKALSVGGNFSYTEPLSKVAFLTGVYGISVANNSASRLSYDRQQDGTWNDDPNALFSSDYDFRVLTHTGKATLRFVYKKYNFSLGTAAFFTNFGQKDLLNDTSFNREYTNLAPTATFNYNFSKQHRISFSYNGRTRQPSLEQIQPLRQNTDPLNISIGNPLLKQEFRNTLNLSWNNYKVLTGQYFYASGSFSFVNDAITQSQNIDESGRRTYQYINTGGNYNSWFYASTGRKLSKLDLQLGMSANAQLGRGTSIVNGQQNISHNNSYTAGISLSKDWTKNDKPKAYLSLEPTFTYNDNKATISVNTTSYWSAGIEFEGFIELPWKLRLSSSVAVSLRQKTDVFSRNNNVVRWDAYCARKLGKDNKSEIRLSVFDILNQNLGFSRYASDINITENSYNTIRRYGLLSFVWNFAKRPAGMKAPEDDE